MPPFSDVLLCGKPWAQQFNFADGLGFKENKLSHSVSQASIMQIKKVNFYYPFWADIKQPS